MTWSTFSATRAARPASSARTTFHKVVIRITLPPEAEPAYSSRAGRIGESQGSSGVACVHVCVYIETVKGKELERRLRGLGWIFQRHGGKHDVWVNADGSFSEFVPRHMEINEKLAQVILRRAKERK